MPNEIQYALMAGASYISTRDEKNRFPVLLGWSESVGFRETKTSGFEATFFENAKEIVISYAGTYEKDKAGDWAANLGLAAGAGSMQLLQAGNQRGQHQLTF